MSINSKRAKQQHVRVGVGVIVLDPSNPTKFFCGIRKGSHGAGMLALPGGHLEMMEQWEDCARREVKEEMNLDLFDVEFAYVTNDMMSEEEKHYVTIFMMGKCKGKPVNMEPDKCAGWESYSWSDLRDTYENKRITLFGPLETLVKDEPPAVLKFLSADV